MAEGNQESNGVVELRSVTLKEFADWLQNNLQWTWYHGEGGAFSKMGKGGSPIFKYLRPSLDTRDMKIFNIDTDVGEADFREALQGGETILDLLDMHINKTRPLPTESDLQRKLMSRFPDLDYEQVKEALKFIASDCIEELFIKKGGHKRNYDWKAKKFTYHDMREEFENIVKEI